MILELEELAANAWPGLSLVLVDGWISRFAAGHTRRANSVLPLHAGTGPLDTRIARCEALARNQGLEPTFKITGASVPAGLDGELERRGYVRTGESTVRVLDRLAGDPPVLPGGLEIRVTEQLDEAWFGFHTALGGRNAEQAPVARAILEHIVPARRFLLLEGTDGPVACALVVLEAGWGGIFDLAVRPDLRGRGLGRLAMAAAAAQAARAGARRAYLQVVRGNEPAERLYQSLGYTVAYPYWYRVRPGGV